MTTQDINRAISAANGRQNKFGNSRTEVAGHLFDSKKEGERYKELTLLEKAGAITTLCLQQHFPLVVGSEKVGEYIADFTYYEKGRYVVEDVKSPATRTPVYKLKKRLMHALHGIDIQEV